MSDGLNHDLVIVGSGPAGMAASLVAAEQGERVLVLDEQRQPGGQVFRAIEKNDAASRPELGDSYYAGSKLIRSFRRANVDYRPGTTVWYVSSEGEVGFTQDGEAKIVKAGHVVVATGAMERPFPVKGWTNAGVMSAGAAQVLLKEAGIGIENAVFAGTGPLLYLVVYQYLQAGIPVKAVLDLTPAENYFAAVRHLPAAILSSGKLLRGQKWKRRITRSNIPFLSGIRNIRICGTGAVNSIEYLVGSTWNKIETQNVLLHQGVVPNINISASAGCDTRWNERQAAWTVVVDEWFRSSQSRISVVGDGAAIGGAVAAQHAGYLAALGALERLGKIDTTILKKLARAHAVALRAELRLQPFLETLFRPARHMRIPVMDDVVVCRCEEIHAGQIREFVGIGCSDPNQVKSFSRCGMGPCQGRFCGHTVSELIADIENRPVGEVGYFRLRPPVKPLRLSELATLSDLPKVD